MTVSPADDLAPAPGPQRHLGPRHHPWRWLAGVVIALVAAIVTAWIVFTTSPTPGALLIRDELNKQGAELKRSMAKVADQIPQARAVNVVRNQPYLPGDAEARLDVYSPSVGVGETVKAHPTIVWVHGGGWLAGGKSDWAPYFELLAGHGFTVASIDYGLAPERKYPTAIKQINAALGYLVGDAKRLHVDPEHLVLAGDSAGAQLASQVAAIITNGDFARTIGITPAIGSTRLRGVLLHSGVYDARPFTHGDTTPGGPVGFGIATLMWAYAGTKDWDAPIFQQMSTIDHVTGRYPPTFITAGNDDELTAGQSRPLAARLRKLGVPVETAFYAPSYRPKLPHEFQFYLETHAAQDVLDRTVRWARQPAAAL